MYKIKLLGSVVVMALSVWAPALHAMEQVDWLYEVEVPVASNNDAERDRAAAEGLLVVLSRLTGLSSVPRTQQVATALEDVQGYYGAYGLIRKRDDRGARQLYMSLTYQPGPVLELLRAAQLPVWWSQRPTVVAWVVVEEDGKRRVLSAADAHPLARELQEQGRVRGLQVTLPVLDLDEQMAVPPADVWGRIGNTLVEASTRYAADLILTGRFSVSSDVPDATGQPVRGYRGDWEVWLDDEPLTYDTRDANAVAAARAPINDLANRLAEKFSVLPRGLRRQTYSIAGLNGAQDYMDFMALVGNMEFIDRVDVIAVREGRLQLSLASHADVEQLVMLLTAQDRMSRDDFYQGEAIALTWRG